MYACIHVCMCIYLSSVYHIFTYYPFISYLSIIYESMYVSIIFLFDVYDICVSRLLLEVTGSLKLQFSLPFICMVLVTELWSLGMVAGVFTHGVILPDDSVTFFVYLLIYFPLSWFSISAQVSHFTYRSSTK